jgi:hypothetical protein
VDRKQPAPGLAPCRAAVHLTVATQPTIASDGKRNWASAYTSLLFPASVAYAITARLVKNGSSMRRELRGRLMR